MKIDFPIPKQGMELVGLWQEAFGDSLEFIEGFFCTAYSPSRCRCVTMDGKVVAGLYWLDCEMNGQRIAYLYAVATKKSHQGQGICKQLMADTHAHLALRGYDGVVLVPQSPELRRFYEKLGYRNATTIRAFSCTAGAEPVPLHRIDRAEYAAARRALLPEGSVLQEKENVAYLETMSFFYRGEDFLLAARREGSTLQCPELLGNAGTAPGILKALSCQEGIFHTPGEGEAFAMFMPLSEKAEQPKYFGLAFD